VKGLEQSTSFLGTLKTVILKTVLFPLGMDEAHACIIIVLK
jgi:hypothetical protein